MQAGGTSGGRMNCTSPRYLALVSLTSLLAFSTYCLEKSMAMPITDYIYTVSIHVLAEDQETQASVQDLNASDFQIFDNGALVKPLYFWSGSSPGSRPLAIWLLVGCPEKAQGQGGISFPPRDTQTFKQALTSLDSTSTVGVAHWCTNGHAGTDLLPTQAAMHL